MVISGAYLFGLAATVFIAVSLTIAAVRWFHLCRPYDRNPRYYYPGRPYVTGIYLNALLLLPYALHPESADAWYLARLYFLPVTIFHFTILQLSYFGGVMQWKKWQGPILIVSLPVVLAMLAAFVLAVWPGEQVGSLSPALSRATLFVLGIIVTGACIAATALVLSWAKRFDADDFSNQADFPVTSARRWIVMVIVNLVLCWVGAIAARPGVLAGVMLLFAASSVLFIITALHPHRREPLEEEVPEEGKSRRAPAGKKHQEILQAVHQVVVEQEAYLDAHLTIQDVADRSGYSRSALSSLFKAELGGFFSYVNGLRVQHVDAYLQEHPSATLQEAVLESGFNSRQVYYKVSKELKTINNQ